MIVDSYFENRLMERENVCRGLEKDLLTMVHLNGQVVLVTGAGSGIGQALAGMCSEAGAKVALTARLFKVLKNVLREQFDPS